MNWLYILPGTGEFVKRRGYRCLVFGGRADGDDSLRAAERRLIVRVLGETGWNIHEASRRLEISRPTLYSKIKKHEIARDE